MSTENGNGNSGAGDILTALARIEGKVDGLDRHMGTLEGKVDALHAAMGAGVEAAQANLVDMRNAVNKDLGALSLAQTRMANALDAHIKETT